MSKKDEQKANSNGHDSGQIKVRVIEFELNGRNATLAEGIKAVTAAITSRAVIVQEPKRPALPAVANPITTTVLEAAETEQPEVGAVVIEEQDVQDDAATDTNGNGTPKARRKQVPKAPTFLSSLDLTTAPVSLQDFVTAKNPTALNDKYLVVATWFKEQMKTDEINIDHIFTAFRTLDWPTPDDLAAIFRTLKHSKQYFDKGDSVGGYKVTFLATNYVAKMGAATK